jgi:mono/diheme cytochrome c family protein
MGASSGQAATPRPQATATSTPATADKPRALLDQYCVTCHNDRLKTANLSLQGADLTKVSEHAELWEKVIRKLRAGVMPPPDLPRPSLAEYDGLRDWLEAEIDRAAPLNPGTKVLHRLNRTDTRTSFAISSIFGRRDDAAASR